MGVKIARILTCFVAAACGLVFFSYPTCAQLHLVSRPSDFSYALSDTTLRLKDNSSQRLVPLQGWRKSHYEFRSTFSRRPSLFTLRPLGEHEQGLCQVKPQRGRINSRRAWLLGSANAGAIFFGFRQAIASWGKTKGGFHFKEDWAGDRLAQIDELSHLMWGYKMTQFLYCAYRWAGFSSKASHLISVSQTALVLTMVEYPIDAYNPKQGLGVSDLVFDYAGIGFAYAKERYAWLGDFDLKISSRRNILLGNQPLFAQTYEQFDNFVYWLTYRTRLFLPQKVFCFGLGYGVTHHGDEPNRHIFGGIGLSLPDFLSLFGEELGRRVGFLETFYPNLNIEF